MAALSDVGVAVPKGFETDGASIPRVLWPFLGSPFSPRYMTAALVHDYLYRFPRGIGRREADDLFRRYLLRDQVKPWLAKVMWLAVRVFGQSYWNRCRRGS